MREVKRRQKARKKKALGWPVFSSISFSRSVVCGVERSGAGRWG
jgi:hypothetical protein